MSAPHMLHTQQTPDQFGKPTPAIVGAAWFVLALGCLVYGISLWRANMDQFEKAFLLATLLFGLVSAVTLQKAVRDRHEGVPVTSIFIGVSWLGMLISLGFLGWGAWNLDVLPSEIGTYAMSYVVAVFGVIIVQKNVRDLIAFKARHPEQYGADAAEARRQTRSGDDSR